MCLVNIFVVENEEGSEGMHRDWIFFPSAYKLRIIAGVKSYLDHSLHGLSHSKETRVGVSFVSCYVSVGQRLHITKEGGVCLGSLFQKYKLLPSALKVASSPQGGGTL